MGALLVIAAAAAKVFRPGNTTNALRAGGIPLGKAAVRIGAIIEGAIGIGSLVGGRLPIEMLAISYAGFALFVAWALFKGSPLSSCGCFGEADSPPSITHVVVNLFFFGSAAWAASLPEKGNLVESAIHQSWWGVPYFAEVAVGTLLAYSVMVELPRIRGVLRMAK